MPLTEEALKEALFALLIEKYDLCVKYTFQIAAHILELIVNWNYKKTYCSWSAGRKKKVQYKGIITILPLLLSPENIGNLNKSHQLVLLCFTGYGPQRPNALHH